jgi:hypothetical protein
LVLLPELTFLSPVLTLSLELSFTLSLVFPPGLLFVPGLVLSVVEGLGAGLVCGCCAGLVAGRAVGFARFVGAGRALPPFMDRFCCAGAGRDTARLSPPPLGGECPIRWALTISGVKNIKVATIKLTRRRDLLLFVFIFYLMFVTILLTH